MLSGLTRSPELRLSNVFKTSLHESPKQGLFQYVYDDQGHLIGEYDVAGNLIQETIWFDDVPVATIRLGQSSEPEIYYVHTDHLRTPRLVSKPADNVVVWRWDSTPYGFSASDNDPDGDLAEFRYNLRFPGQYFDEETGLHYNYYRTYDPSTGRYLESESALNLLNFFWGPATSENESPEPCFGACREIW